MCFYAILNKKCILEAPMTLRKAKPTTVIKDWFYMNESDLSVRSLYHCIQEYAGDDIEIWEELGVIEVTLSEETTLDFERLKPFFQDQEDNEFLKTHNVHTMYLVSFPENEKARVTSIMKQIIKECRGFFVEDTPDFNNIIR